MTQPYRIEWTYLEELADGKRPYAEAHCSFLIRFMDLPPGSAGQCAFFATNVASSTKARELGLGSAGRRGYMVTDGLTRDAFCKRVTDDVAHAFATHAKAEALKLLDQTYVWRDQDHRDEFVIDVPTADQLRALIEAAFAGVTRGDGVTLHEAIAEDDYATLEEKQAARKLDVDADWHDVPRDVMAKRYEFFSYLDGAGFRYYIPAAVLFCLDEENWATSETPQRTYWSLLPTVAPRDFGKGFGQKFDSEAFIACCGFDDAQVRAIYAFLCFAAVEHDEGVDEEQLPAMRQWRESARRRAN